MDAPVAMSVLGFWAEADAVGKATLALLAAMSAASWYLLLLKSLRVWRVRRHGAQIRREFWAAADLEQAVARAQAVAADHPFCRLAAQLAAGLRTRTADPAALSASLDHADYAASMLRAALQQVSRGLDSGLGVLASVGATAPFVGLFGTVWGIYHALIAIGFTGQATLDKVAGPVGEALIMTALGIAVAVPAVLAYNFLLRANRDIARSLDGFAQDLHACVLKAPQAADGVPQAGAVTMNKRAGA